MSHRTKLGRRIPAKDTCHVIPILDQNAEPAFELLIYGLDDNDIYLCPNPYVSQALNRRNIPSGYSTSPFFVERIR